jgi:hypothetical protein
MEAIILTDDELRLFEKRFGPSVRQMGPWNSDGTFGYATVPMVAVEKAAEALQNPNLIVALPRLEQSPGRTKPFIELLETFGTALIEKIVADYREGCLERIPGPRLAPMPPKRETRRVSVSAAAG